LVWVPALVGEWASAGRGVSPRSEVEVSTESAEAVSPGVVVVVAPGEEVAVGVGEVGDMAIPDMPRLMPQLMPTRGMSQLIRRTTVTRL
jgi:hypothetical protein